MNSTRKRFQWTILAEF
ncbi:hypothetical protein ACJIZ3_010250 [Penstemon smallii]|uniref:Uncharacterized protein n=1 Tax=Penstemon smallii TaxID=265156 RepID=A0ABD3TET3_9LAMI